MVNFVKHMTLTKTSLRFSIIVFVGVVVFVDVVELPQAPGDDAQERWICT